MATSGLVRIGEIVKPHGLKGEVCVHCDADSPFLFDRVRTLVLVREPIAGAPEDQGKRYVLRSWRSHQGRPMLTLENVADRNAAEELRSLAVYVPAADLPPPDEGEAYLYELLDCEVFLQDGTRLGRIDHYLFPSSEQEIWAILADNGREILFPAHQESVVDIDLAARRVIVDPPEGLLDIYLG